MNSWKWGHSFWPQNCEILYSRQFPFIRYYAVPRWSCANWCHHQNDKIDIFLFWFSGYFITFCHIYHSDGNIVNVLINRHQGTSYSYTSKGAKEHGSFPYNIALTLTARRICLGHSIPSILIYVHSIGYILSLEVNFEIWNIILACLWYDLWEGCHKNMTFWKMKINVKTSCC